MPGPAVRGRRRPTFLEYDEDWHARGFYRVRTLNGARYKLVVCTHTGGGRLFDLENDPHERESLWDRAEYGKIKAEMMEALLREASTYDRAETAAPLRRLNLTRLRGRSMNHEIHQIHKTDSPLGRFRAFGVFRG